MLRFKYLIKWKQTLIIIYGCVRVCMWHLYKFTRSLAHRIVKLIYLYVKTTQWMNIMRYIIALIDLWKYLIIVHAVRIYLKYCNRWNLTYENIIEDLLSYFCIIIIDLPVYSKQLSYSIVLVLKWIISIQQILTFTFGDIAQHEIFILHPKFSHLWINFAARVDKKHVFFLVLKGLSS